MSTALPCIKVLMKTLSAVAACEKFSDFSSGKSLKRPDNVLARGESFVFSKARICDFHFSTPNKVVRFEIIEHFRRFVLSDVHAFCKQFHTGTVNDTINEIFRLFPLFVSYCIVIYAHPFRSDSSKRIRIILLERVRTQRGNQRRIFGTVRD